MPSRGTFSGRAPLQLGVYSFAMHRLAFLSTAFACFWFTVLSGQETGSSARLEIEVVGLKSDDGIVRIALYDSAETFPEKGKEFRKAKVVPKGKRAVAIIDGIPHGDYAIALYHDENSNDGFDQGFLGWPLETYGFSNNVRPGLSAPKFAKARFTVDRATVIIQIRAR